LLSEYDLWSNKIPVCLTKMIFDFHLRANEIYISDYNGDNHSYDFRSFPVHLMNTDKPTYFNNNRSARIFLLFNERRIARRKSNCGDKTLAPFTNDWYLACESGGGGSTDIFLKALFATGNDTMETLTVDADQAGVYTSISDDGSSGTITLNYNGGGFVSFASLNPLTLVATDTLIIKRTVFSASGYVKLTGTY